MADLSGNSSVFVPDDAPAYDMPVTAITRPLPSVLNEAKVQVGH
jgi:hypothetical protein